MTNYGECVHSGNPRVVRRYSRDADSIRGAVRRARRNRDTRAEVRGDLLAFAAPMRLPRGVGRISRRLYRCPPGMQRAEVPDARWHLLR